jgi:hypothetical protein
METLQERTARLRRHESQCTICSHPLRLDIEDAWVNWGNTTLLAKDYGVSRDALYRHMHAVGLYQERQKKRKRLYENILERADITQFTGGNLVAVLKGYAALCAQEEDGERATRSPSQDEPCSEPMPETQLAGENARLSGEAPSERDEEGENRTGARG